MRKRSVDIGRKPFLALVAVLGMALLLFAPVLAQTPGGRDVPESRQAMGLNLPPNRMDQFGWVPIDDYIATKLESLGAKWVRLEFRARGDPQAVPVGDYHSIIDHLAAHGIETLGLLDYTTVPRPQAEWDSPEFREAFTQTAISLVTEFKDDVQYWEIWNEQDIGYDPAGPGGDTYMSPQGYARLLASVYQAIKDTDPQATVLLGGLSNAWKADGKGAGNYLAALYQELSDLGYGPGTWPFDVVAVHPYYGHNPDPNVYLFSGGDYILRSNLWSVMNSRGDGSKRFWITEIGWNTNTKQWVCMPPFVSEENQAAYLRRSWNIFLRELTSETEALVDKVFWYQYQDHGVSVDPARCPLATATPPARVAEPPPAEIYTRVRPPRVTPTPHPGQPRSPSAVIDAWWGLVHGDYVPKPSHDTYRDYRLPTHYLYLPVLVRDAVAP